MSSGGDTTTVQNFPEWAIPYAQEFLGRAGQVADLPYQPYTGQTVAQLNPYQLGGYDAIAARAVGGSPVSDAASGEITRTLQGGYLNNNPHLEGMIDLASRDVMRNMDTLSARSGSFGNSGVNESTMRGLADVATGIRGQDYARERGYMQSALGMAPTIANQDYFDAQQLLSAGQGLQGQEQRNLTDAYSRWQEAQGYPQQQLGTLGRALGLNYGSSSTGPGANNFANALGAGLAAYGAYNNGGGSSGSSGSGK
jgi:hypothetical protein